MAPFLQVFSVLNDALHFWSMKFKMSSANGNRRNVSSASAQRSNGNCFSRGHDGRKKESEIDENGTSCKVQSDEYGTLCKVRRDDEIPNERRETEVFSDNACTANAVADGNNYENGDDKVSMWRNVRKRCVPVAETEPGGNDAYLSHKIQQFACQMSKASKYHIGYPLNLDVETRCINELYELLQYNLNNAGDPFIAGNLENNSKHFEVGVLDWFADLWELPRHECWGYVTTGGTEGLMHGILVGRELLPDAILYTSNEAHYSLPKIARMYKMHLELVDTSVSGEIDCVDFRRRLLRNKGRPAVVNVNIGTTMKGAVDDLDLVIQSLLESGYSHEQFYIHCDGALLGLMIRFMEGAPNLSFKKKQIASISVSGHKFLGCPMPCGIQMVRSKHIEALSSDVEYIGTKDGTITGSRNGHTPLFLWLALNRKGYYGFKKEVETCLKNARHLRNKLRSSGISAMLNEFSCIVVFERPRDEAFVLKWQLACHGNIAHVVVMQHVTTEIIDTFVDELVEKRSTWFGDGNVGIPCIVNDVGSTNCVCPVHVSNIMNFKA